MNYQNYINNEWCDAKSGNTLDVENPFTEQVIAQVPASDEPDVNNAVEAAQDAFESWRKLTAGERRDYMRPWPPNLANMPLNWPKQSLLKWGNHSAMQLAKLRMYLNTLNITANWPGTKWGELLLQ